MLKHRPVALFVVIGGIVAARILHLDERGVALLGEVPQGLPMPALPLVSRTDVNTLLPLAMACFVLVGGGDDGHRAHVRAPSTAIDSMPRRNSSRSAAPILVAGLGSGFPVSGGMSQSLVNETGGARTPLSGLVAALITLVVVLFFTGLLRHLPQPVLAAIVLVAVTGLVQVDALRQHLALQPVGIRRRHGRRCLASSARGCSMACCSARPLSLLLLIGRASRPRVTEIGRVPGTSYFADLVRHPENERAAGCSRGAQ